jgi:hypothetical protein
VTPEPVLYTFHKIREQSEQGNADAWRAFLDFYGPVFVRLLEVHAAIPSREALPLTKKMLAQLTANNFDRLRATPRQSEREFLGDLRGLLLEVALDSGAVQNSQPEAESAFTLEKIGKLLDGLPLLHKEMLFFRVAGYTENTIERLMRMSPRMAEKAFERLAGEYAPARQTDHDRSPWPAAWLALLKQACASKSDNCTPPQEIVRIQDGQVSWYDKEPVEKHVSGCLHCLNAWTAIREVGYWRYAAEPLSASQIGQLLEVIPVEKPPAKKSFFQRLRS